MNQKQVTFAPTEVTVKIMIECREYKSRVQTTIESTIHACNQILSNVKLTEKQRTKTELRLQTAENKLAKVIYRQDKKNYLQSVLPVKNLFKSLKRIEKNYKPASFIKFAPKQEQIVIAPVIVELQSELPEEIKQQIDECRNSHELSSVKKTLSLQYHPDKNNNDGTMIQLINDYIDKRKEAVRIWDEIDRIYEQLTELCSSFQLQFLDNRLQSIDDPFEKKQLLQDYLESALADDNQSEQSSDSDYSSESESEEEVEEAEYLDPEEIAFAQQMYQEQQQEVEIQEEVEVQEEVQEAEYLDPEEIAFAQQIYQEQEEEKEEEYHPDHLEHLIDIKPETDNNQSNDSTEVSSQQQTTSQQQSESDSEEEEDIDDNLINDDPESIAYNQSPVVIDQIEVSVYEKLKIVGERLDRVTQQLAFSNPNDPMIQQILNGYWKEYEKVLEDKKQVELEYQTYVLCGCCNRNIRSLFARQCESGKHWLCHSEGYQHTKNNNRDKSYHELIKQKYSDVFHDFFIPCSKTKFKQYYQYTIYFPDCVLCAKDYKLELEQQQQKQQKMEFQYSQWLQQRAQEALEEEDGWCTLDQQCFE